MKFIVSLILMAVVGHAAASEIVLKCVEDRTASDGARAELVVTKAVEEGSYAYSLVVASYGRGGSYKQESRVEMGSCNFSGNADGLGSCSEITPDGFRGANRLVVGLIFMNHAYELVATNYFTDENGLESVSQEVFFDVSSCPVLP